MSEGEDRTKYLGGTDVSAILGLNPYKTPLQVWLQKTGNAPEQADNPAMKWGRLLEAPIADEFARLRGVQLKPGGFVTIKDKPYLAAHPDRLFADDSAVLEVKTAGVRSAARWGQDGSPEMPPEYLAQVHWYILLKMVPVAYVAVLIGGSDYREYEVKADAEVEGRMQAAAERFWTDHVLTGKEPAIDGDATTAEYLARKFKVKDRKSVV
jgi:putative phage-type endonuclease